MKTIFHFPTVLSGITLFTTPVVSQQQENKQPNIVVILADDLGTNELGCYGGRNLQTPNIDRIASEGIRMTNNYASATMSVPVRASLYTGLYPARHGSYQNHKPTYDFVKTAPDYLRRLGYRVGRTGKDHPSKQPDVYTFERIKGFPVNCIARKAPYTTDGIDEFIHRNDEEPFCLYVCSIHPHVPWTWGDPEKFNPDSVVLPPNCVDNKKTREIFCKYLAEIQELDNEVGAVLQLLETSGKLENTLVIFLGEQGPQMPFGKWTCYRYGQHSAFMARYPKKIVKGTVSDALIQYEDILPTMIEFGGGTPIRGLDGESFLGVLFGENNAHREWAYGIHNNIPSGDAYPIRSIQDKRYKLIVNLIPEVDYYHKNMMNPASKGIWSSWRVSAKTDKRAQFLTERFAKRPAIELYDLENDAWELNNIAHLPEHAERIVLMQEELKKWMTQQGDQGILMDTEFEMTQY